MRVFRTGNVLEVRQLAWLRRPRSAAVVRFASPRNFFGAAL